MKVIGIDFSTSSSKPTGMAKIIGRDTHFFSVFRDVEIKNEIKSFNPDIIVMCCPLRPTRGILRDCDKELEKRGYKVQPLNTDYMKSRVARTVKLIEQVRRGYFIETNSSASGKILELDKTDIDNFVRRMRKAGFLEMNKPKQVREMNAGIAAMVGALKGVNMTEEIGEDKLTIPLARESKPKQ